MEIPIYRQWGEIWSTPLEPNINTKLTIMKRFRGKLNANYRSSYACTETAISFFGTNSYSRFQDTLKGWRSPMQIWTRRRCPSDTLCILHWRFISSSSINLSLLTGSVPSTAKNWGQTQFNFNRLNFTLICDEEWSTSSWIEKMELIKFDIC